MVKPTFVNGVLMFSVTLITVTLSYILIRPNDIKKLQTSYSVECYSGEKLIYQGNTHGKYDYSLSGYGFYDINDTKIKVSGNCLLKEIK